MNSNLIALCCREFPTREAAQNAGGYRSDVIRYPEPEPIVMIPVDRPVPIAPLRHREILLQQLPSGLWAWVPTHPDDMAVISEHKIQSDKKFEQTQFLCAALIVSPECFEDKQRIEGIKEHLRREVLLKFWSEHGKLDTIYRFAMSEQFGLSGDRESIGMYKLGVTLLFAKEKYSDDRLQ